MQIANHQDAWELHNFKGVGNALLPLSGLSVIAGANSAGKSSLTQSLLLLSQSRGGDILLNGPLVRFGEARDVIREGSPSIQVGWNFSVPRRARRESIEQGLYRTSVTLAAPKGADKAAQSTLIVTEVSISEGDRVRFYATNRYVDAGNERSHNPNSIWGDSLLRVKTIAEKPAPARTFVTFSGLNPSRAIYKREHKVLASRMLSKFIELLRTPGDYSRFMAQDFVFSALSGTQIGRMPEFGSELDEYRRSIVEFLESAEDKSPSEVNVDADIRQAFDRISEIIAEGDDVALSLGEHPRGLFGPFQTDSSTDIFYPSAHREAWRELRFAFLKLRDISERVKYIGPLREEPQVLSTTGGRHESIPAGLRGEYTADLLIRSRNSKVGFRDPDGESREEPLQTAVGTWAAWLGMGQSVKVTDQGKLGRGIIVVVDGKDRDLTTIGVGVSQLLPVITLVLAAPQKSIVILEQPELHLHPAIQSRLASFFMLARPDISLIVETHSEYLITRLRRLNVEATGRNVDLNVLFSESSEEGASIKPLPFSSLGDIAEWPSGFFDTQEDEERKLLLALRNKHRRLSR